MSDRVAMICGSTPGRDHFPWPVVDAGSTTTGGAFNNYPTSMDLDSMMSMYWRVRTWRVHGTLTRVIIGPTTFTDDFDFIVTVGDNLDNAPGDQSSTITREAQLVLGAYTRGGDVLNSEGDGSLHEVGMFGTNSPISPAWWTTDELPLWPYLVVVVYSGAPIGVYLDSRPDSFSTPGEVDFITAKIVLNGTDHPIPIYVETGSFGGVISGTLTIEPASYWPYANRDGDPVYDTSTGAQLISPIDAGIPVDTMTQNNAGAAQTLNVVTDGNPWEAV